MTEGTGSRQDGDRREALVEGLNMPSYEGVICCKSNAIYLRNKCDISADAIYCFAMRRSWNKTCRGRQFLTTRINGMSRGTCPYLFFGQCVSKQLLQSLSVLGKQHIK